jgi:hypothetical protein
VNCPPFPVILSFWVELVGACNSIKGKREMKRNREKIKEKGSTNISHFYPRYTVRRSYFAKRFHKTD